MPDVKELANRVKFAAMQKRLAQGNKRTIKKAQEASPTNTKGAAPSTHKVGYSVQSEQLAPQS